MSRKLPLSEAAIRIFLRVSSVTCKVWLEAVECTSTLPFNLMESIASLRNPESIWQMPFPMQTVVQTNGLVDRASNEKGRVHGNTVDSVSMYFQSNNFASALRIRDSYSLIAGSGPISIAPH
jgi:hypothetical protein